MLVYDKFHATPTGDYDALSVMMLLPRLVFKAELIIDQLKQQVRERERESSSVTATHIYYTLHLSLPDQHGGGTRVTQQAKG